MERDLLTGMEGKVDLLVANLPYIPTEKLKSLLVYSREPGSSFGWRRGRIAAYQESVK